MYKHTCTHTVITHQYNYIDCNVVLYFVSWNQKHVLRGTWLCNHRYGSPLNQHNCIHLYLYRHLLYHLHLQSLCIPSRLYTLVAAKLVSCKHIALQVYTSQVMPKYGPTSQGAHQSIFKLISVCSICIMYTLCTTMTPHIEWSCMQFKMLLQIVHTASYTCTTLSDSRACSDAHWQLQLLICIYPSSISPLPFISMSNSYIPFLRHHNSFNIGSAPIYNMSSQSLYVVYFPQQCEHDCT